ncbi:MAG: molybdopterin molybdotransferase MoeA [Sphingomonas sp.]|uniref:molybdopterin molybdotransferase MoeA n=1 Tax=Sphingomonas sp. TaxID=28214 RepID=UPI003F7CE993
MTGARRGESVDAALDAIARAIKPLGVETIASADAYGRVTAKAVVACRAVPPVAMSAMDGFALRSADTALATVSAPARLAIYPAEVVAGVAATMLEPGSAIRISTGGAIPEGADCVIARERATRDGDWLVVGERCDAGRNVRSAGEDFAPGATVIAAGRPVTPAAIGGMIASGVAALAVRRHPAVALLATGSEFADGAALDSNGPMVRALAHEAGVEIDLIGPVADRVEAIDAALDRAAGHDLILSSGGVSGGDHDLVRAALERRGARIVFHGLPMRPGKPILFAILADGRPFVGLPGNPVAAIVGFRFFVTAVLRAMLGLAPERGEQVDVTVAAREGVTMFLRARLGPQLIGPRTVDIDLDQRSHVLSSVIAADCWLRVDIVGGRRRTVAYPLAASLFAP